ncbi:MAG TPA: hypothetical protein VKV73_24435 [Chloroflexota bacterium]|nr:hypothetical protein [Chloroflexota bacterium]
MSNGSTLDVRELLRLIAEQQASFVKLQQLVVEHVLSESQPGFSTVKTPPAPALSHPVAATDVSNAAPPAYHTTSDPEVVRSTEPEPLHAAPASTPHESGAALSDPPQTVPPPPEELPSPPSALPSSTDSPFGDTPPDEAGATTPTTAFASVPTTVTLAPAAI